MAIRNAALAQNKKTFTLKQASHGFALLNMTVSELGAVALNDPFTSYYTRAYVGMTQINNGILEQYNNATFGQEITDISEYLKMSQFFESVLEPALGVRRYVIFVRILVFSQITSGRIVKDSQCRGVSISNTANTGARDWKLKFRTKRFRKEIKIIHKWSSEKNDSLHVHFLIY